MLPPVSFNYERKCAFVVKGTITNYYYFLK